MNGVYSWNVGSANLISDNFPANATFVVTQLSYPNYPLCPGAGSYGIGLPTQIVASNYSGSWKVIYNWSNFGNSS